MTKKKDNKDSAHYNEALEIIDELFQLAIIYPAFYDKLKKLYTLKDLSEYLDYELSGYMKELKPKTKIPEEVFLSTLKEYIPILKNLIKESSKNNKYNVYNFQERAIANELDKLNKRKHKFNYTEELIDNLTVFNMKFSELLNKSSSAKEKLKDKVEFISNLNDLIKKLSNLIRKTNIIFLKFQMKIYCHSLLMRIKL